MRGVMEIIFARQKPASFTYPHRAKYSNRKSITGVFDNRHISGEEARNEDGGWCG